MKGKENERKGRRGKERKENICKGKEKKIEGIKRLKYIQYIVVYFIVVNKDNKFFFFN